MVDMVKNKLFLFVFLLALLMLTTASSCGSTYTEGFLFIVYGEKEFTNIKCRAYVNIYANETKDFELIEPCFGSLTIATTKPNEISKEIWMKIEANNYDDTLYAGAYIIGQSKSFPSSYDDNKINKICSLLEKCAYPQYDKYCDGYIQTLCTDEEKQILFNYIKDACNLNNKWIKKLNPKDNILYLGNY